MLTSATRSTPASTSVARLHGLAHQRPEPEPQSATTPSSIPRRSAVVRVVRSGFRPVDARHGRHRLAVRHHRYTGSHGYLRRQGLARDAPRPGTAGPGGGRPFRCFFCGRRDPVAASWSGRPAVLERLGRARHLPPCSWRIAPGDVASWDLRVLDSVFESPARAALIAPRPRPIASPLVVRCRAGAARPSRRRARSSP
jgi:hypothetical protein